MQRGKGSMHAAEIVCKTSWSLFHCCGTLDLFVETTCAEVFVRSLLNFTVSRKWKDFINLLSRHTRPHTDKCTYNAEYFMYFISVWLLSLVCNIAPIKLPSRQLHNWKLAMWPLEAPSSVVADGITGQSILVSCILESFTGNSIPLTDKGTYELKNPAVKLCSKMELLLNDKTRRKKKEQRFWKVNWTITHETLKSGFESRFLIQ